MGPADELYRLGIPVTSDVPGVGEGVRDHPKTWISWHLKESADPALKAKQTHRRALYGIDMMLDEQLNPYLLEITFSPDVNRA